MKPSSATPNLLLATVTLLCVVVVVVVIAVATVMPRLGLTLVSGIDGQGVYVLRTDPSSRLHAPVERFSELLAVGDIEVTPQDLIPEPDSLETYAQYEVFLARQTALFEQLAQDNVTLRLRGPLNTFTTVVAHPEGSPLWRLPDGFWVQLLTGVAGTLIAGWVWALRPRSPGPIMFMLTAIGLLMATATSALYANRELAIDGTAFAVMVAINHVGVLLFGLAMVALLLSYPRQLVHPRWFLAIPLAIVLYMALDLAHGGLGPSQLYIFVALAMLGIIGCVGLQWWRTRRSPSDRAALGWLGLSILAGCGAFTLLGAAPVLFDTPAGIPQSHVTGVLVIVYVGLALGVSRYRLFELGDWSYRILFYTLGALLLLAVDAGLIYLLNVEAAPAFGVSLLFVGFVYLPARDWVWDRVTARRRVGQDELFGSALDIAFAPSRIAGAQQWRALLARLFDPLEVEDVADAGPRPTVSDDGISMLLPAVAGAPPLRLAYPFAGRGLFSPAHVKLAENLVSLTIRAEEGREAYMRGVGEERRRMARDLHDDVGARLLTGLHTADETTRPTLQAALSDIRAIVSGLAGDEASLDRVLAETRHEAARRLEAAGIALNWPLPDTEIDAIQLDYRLHKALTSAVREIVSNAIRHSGASHFTVTPTLSPGHLALRFADDGRGMPAEALAGETAGFGLRNLRHRIEDIGGRLTLASEPAGTSITLHIPLVLTARTPEPGVPDNALPLNSPA
ncbi:ATPase [Devosia oryziradicis]|uniref:ATPase n=1 Tax=Devosia oryziradicis TaxID=2801335 RepID=A0ABX7C3F9_9HYPH|nr:ATP-binding protein [Devosia oryziradicis]QQR37302.1 ATPase [Devosia oryziradicis]